MINVTPAIRLILVAITLLGLACTDSSDNSASEDRADTIQVQPTSTSTLAPAATSTPVPAPLTFTEELLQGTLLSIEDMPTGWTVRLDEDEDDDGTTCGVSLTDRPTALASAEANFQMAALGPFVSEAIAAYPKDEGNASGMK